MNLGVFVEYIVIVRAYRTCMPSGPRVDRERKEKKIFTLPKKRLRKDFQQQSPVTRLLGLLWAYLKTE